ncbi:MAG: STAS domain-containing protein [Clostridiales bacterium]|nr:STAS domain-containing protein [Clostridiales bacterium]
MKVDSSFDEGTLVLRFSGELDHHAAKSTVRDMERAIDRYLPSACEIDFSPLTFMDSSGIAVLLKARRRMNELGGTLRVTGVKGQPGKVLAAAGLERMIDIGAVAV